VNALRRTLYLQAGAWAVAGAALAAAPHFVLVTLFDQAPGQPLAWPRLVGVQAFGLALLMVLVAHRVEELWWWTWAFALVTVAMSVVVALNAAFGPTGGRGAVFWWVFAVVTVGFSGALLHGLYRSSREQPFPT
jgi:hypothetical protein